MEFGRTPLNIGGTFYDCIETRRLFDAASGTVQLTDRERQHVHTCGVCQGVFYVFVCQQSEDSGTPWEGTPAC